MVRQLLPKSYKGRRLLDFVKTVKVEFNPIAHWRTTSSAKEFLVRVSVPYARLGNRAPERQAQIISKTVFTPTPPNVYVEFIDGTVKEWKDTSNVPLQEMINALVMKNLDLSNQFRTDEDEEKIDPNQED
eukprot:GEZU01004198.1.p1 GENE.GEZU01004198.1~~GEZU01004198.1.p1  ORF type:complete len:139 (+),score=29.11 GEZU01004198.1:28-417(+)